jgi:hypothetical protein
MIDRVERQLPHLRQGQSEHGRCGRTFLHVVHTLQQRDGQGVSVTEEHPWHRHRTTGGELLTTSGRGLHFDPRLFQGHGAKGCPRDSRGRNCFHTDVDFSLRPVGLSRCPVGTSGYVDGAAQGMMTRSSNDACKTHAVAATKGAASVLKSLAQRRSKAPYAMLVSQNIFECRATSSSTMAKLIPDSD